MSTQLPDEEQWLLQHYRQLSDEQPPSALDAHILAAARAQVAPQRPSWPRRLGQWLTAASRAQRGSLAFGSLASVGLVLGLVWQGLPQRDEMLEQHGHTEQSAMVPTPAAVMKPQGPPAMAAAPAAERQPARSAPAPAAPPSAGEPAALPVPRAAARIQARAQADAQMQMDEAAPAELDVVLLEILQLREAGRAEEAERLLDGVRGRHSEETLQERLGELERQRKARP
jgi:hypothetical protein